MTLAKRFIVGVAGIGIVGLLAILAMHHNGAIETEVLIDRPPHDVWQVLTATDSYPSWTSVTHLLRRLIHLRITASSVEA